MMRLKLIMMTMLFSFSLMLSSVYADESMADNKKGSGSHSEMSEVSPEEAEMMKKWMEYATPGENHRALDGMIGEWNHTVTWWQTPDSEPMVSDGSSSIEWILDGRFLVHMVAGTMMGQPFNGMGIMGYDNQKQEYDSIWLDSMGTGMMTGTAKMDKETNSLKESGDFSCSMTGTRRDYKAVLTMVDDNQFTYEMYTNDMEGNRFKSMSIQYDRINK